MSYSATKEPQLTETLFDATNRQNSVADLGFPRGGGRHPRGGANLLSDQFFLKTAWK